MVFVVFSSDSWEDEMANAAAWLAYAVGKSDPAYNGYLTDAKNYFKPGVPWAMSWNEKRPAVGVCIKNEIAPRHTQITKWHALYAP